MICMPIQESQLTKPEVAEPHGQIDVGVQNEPDTITPCSMLDPVRVPLGPKGASSPFLYVAIGLIPWLNTSFLKVLWQLYLSH